LRRHYSTPARAGLLPYADRVRQLEYFRARDEEWRSAISTMKLELGCIDCGYAEHPEALDFDHVRGVKRHEISQSRNATELFNELEKCEVVCANCHRVRTRSRRGNA
jgi:hypothetical protein